MPSSYRKLTRDMLKCIHFYITQASQLRFILPKGLVSNSQNTGTLYKNNNLFLNFLNF